jgi:hypothetical protein
MNEVIEEPICTQSGNSSIIEEDLKLGRKYVEQTRTNVAREEVVGAHASFAMMA